MIEVQREFAEGAMEMEMKIRGLMMDPVTNMPIVVLKDVQGNAIRRSGLASTKPTPSRSKLRRCRRHAL